MLCVVATALSFGGIACGGAAGTRSVLRGTELAGGAVAQVTAQVEAARGFTRIVLSASALVPPSRVAPEATAFVAWARKSAAAPWSRVGALAYDPDARAGQADLTTPFTSFDLLITAEATAEGEAPEGKPLFLQRIQ
jgi:hypothetical protein